MKRSTNRILTTHVGSLPRPDDLVTMLADREAGKAVDEQAFRQRVRHAVDDVVRQQVEAGIDVVTDGEVGKAGFTNYVDQRLAGFEARPQMPGAPRIYGAAYLREYQAFPDYYDSEEQYRPRSICSIPRVCSGPISYIGQEQLQRDIENIQTAVQGLKVEEVFMPAISFSDIHTLRKNEYYASDDEYMAAIADAMREEYEGIIDAGFVVQIDDPLLVTYYARHPELSVEDCRRWAEHRIEILNHSLRGLPMDRIRFHTCYSIDQGPRVHDMELKDIVDVLLKINAGAYSFEAGNPRHDHEWRVWETVKLPEGRILIPGFITNSTVLVEHPQLVADRIVRYARAVGRENVIASADCGFASVARVGHLEIVMAKFQALAEGARLATKELWS
ncbi:MAG TPA: cobalamin-independent methionine synthase II family protein [Chloroflexota bacterium]|nr:cobalamin-independent methionine synthase II family protein [Chloroflexota bacterium]